MCERRTDSAGLIQAEAAGTAISEMVRPMLAAIGQLLENNTAAIEQLASAQAVQNDRLEALERQVRLQAPVSGKQVSYLNDAIRKRARELLDKRGLADSRQAVTKLGNQIRRSALARYGAASLREIPRHEYSVALDMIGIWNDIFAVREVVSAFRDSGQ